MPADPDAVEQRLVLGLQPVREAIKRHGAALREVLIDQRPQPRLDALARFAGDQGASVRRVPQSQLDRMSHGVQHQGVAALAPPLGLVPLSALVEEPELLALALDEIQDPQNFGAVIRSAVGLGPAFVLWGEHASAPLTPATFRASAGAIEHASLCRVRSLTTALDELSRAAVQVVALDAQADVLLADLDLKLPTVLVIGSEGKGLGRQVRKLATRAARLVDLHAVDSLNASVAAGMALYEAQRQRQKLKRSR
ncbi:MAG TPA: RNA methyltransferase [Polyangiaceae bacterium]|nr:RNA methyltransferase [Polyangiaceae bacterium]